MSNNIISFPKSNKRLDVTNTPVNAEEVAKVIDGMKIDFYHDVADNLMDYIVTSIGSLGIDANKDDIQLRDIDIIFMREVLTAFMCRLGGVEHPLKTLPEATVVGLTIDEGTISYDLAVPSASEDD